MVEVLMGTKAQKAALLEIQRIMKLFESQVKARLYAPYRMKYSLEELEEKLEKYLKEIETLIII